RANLRDVREPRRELRIRLRAFPLLPPGRRLPEREQHRESDDGAAFFGSQGHAVPPAYGAAEQPRGSEPARPPEPGKRSEPLRSPSLRSPHRRTEQERQGVSRGIARSGRIDRNGAAAA